VDLPIEMVIFHSYVGLPEGNHGLMRFNRIDRDLAAGKSTV
jgi:hypothetical protein